MATQKKVPHETDLYVDPQTGVYYGQVYIDLPNGRRERKLKSLKTTDIKKARSNLRSLMNKLVKQPGRRKRKLFRDAWPLFLEWGKVEWRPGTWIDVESKGRLHLEPYFKNTPIDEIDENICDDYAREKWEDSPTLKLKLHFDYLSMFLHFCKRRKWLESVPLIKNPDGEEEEGRPYSRKQQAKLLWAARPRVSIEKREKGQALVSDNRRFNILLQIRLGLKLGMRKKEILKLRKECIDWEAGVIRLTGKDTKGKYSRTIPIFNSVFRALKKQCELHKSPYVFPHRSDPNRPQSSNEKAWQAVKERAKVEGKFHWTRTTAATEMGESGNPPAAVAAKLLGMSLTIFEKKYCKPRMENIDRSIR